jgi:glutaredoxin
MSEECQTDGVKFADMSTHKKEKPETVIFGADWCGDCRRAKMIFDRAGAVYRYVDLVQDPAAAEVARDISGRTNIPVIVYPDQSYQVEPSNADMIHKIEELGLA